jgi:hypothetical protein
MKKLHLTHSNFSFLQGGKKPCNPPTKIFYYTLHLFL